MRQIEIELPWTTLIAEVASQSGLVIDLPCVPYRSCANLLEARFWGEVRGFTLAGATSMSARPLLQFANFENDSPTNVLFGPTWTGDGWQGPGSGAFTDISANAAQYLLVRAGWRLTLTLNPGTARPFLRAWGKAGFKLA